jgi:signal transduction histidine kinase
LWAAAVAYEPRDANAQRQIRSSDTRSRAMIRNVVKHLAVTAVAATAVIASGGVWAGDHASKEEAVAMVKKGVAFIKANGKEKGYAEINSKSGQFRDRDLYLTVFGFEGVTRAHAINEKMVGKNLIELRDTDGKEFYRERLELAKTKDAFWQDYKFTNPMTKKIEPKSAYCERLEDSVVCGGIYKQ